MFKNIFSFNGRIQRVEYVISFVFYLTCWIIIRSLISQGGNNGLFGFLMIPLLYIMWAQGAKRCHDIGKSGWWQIVPFYFFVLLSRKSDPWANEYDIPGVPYYGADDYEKPFTIDEETQPAISPAVTPGNTETPIP